MTFDSENVQTERYGGKMKRNDDYERFKPDKETEYEEVAEAVNEKIMKQIDEMSEGITIPDSLTPENMMKKINEAKKTDKRIAKRQKEVRHHKSGRDRFYNRVIACGMVVSVILAAIIICINIGTHSFEVKPGVLNTPAPEKPVNNTGTNKVLSASSREEIVALISEASMKAYHDRNQYLDSGYDMVKNETSDIEYTGTGNNSESDYYKNNDQVEGVTEADSVITDGTYIYSITEMEDVSIMSAENGKIKNVSRISFFEDFDLEKDGYQVFLNNSKLFVNKNKMIILFEYELAQKKETDGSMNQYIYEDVYYPYTNRNAYTVVMQYDLSDIYHPELDNYHIVDGSMVSSRVVEDYVYVITSKDVNTDVVGDEWTIGELKRIEKECIPKIDDKELSYDKIFLVPGEDSAYNYQIVSSYHIGKNELQLTDNSAVLSNLGDVYVSSDYIFTLSVQWERTEDEISGNTKKMTNTQNTKIYKFAYEKGIITPNAVGVVPGSVLNQFSIDEYNGYVRLVSTIEKRTYYENPLDKIGDIDREEEIYSSQFLEENAVFVLDENLDICGKVENIAKDENIYSARFMGDYGYFVTFRQTDPLFVVDLSDPLNPKILDELKVTGFSDYLHPWEDNVLLGVGKEADERGRSTGVKLSLFDISDKTDISEISKYVIENAYSSQMDDYKKMFVAPEKSLFGMQILGPYTEGEFADGNRNNRFWLFKYENGSFTDVLRYEYIDKDGYDYHDYRGLYIGDYLYIISVNKGIVPVNLNDYSVGEFVEFD